MADTPEQEIVSAISAAGWLQGDTVSGDALIEHISEEVLKGQFEGWLQLIGCWPPIPARCMHATFVMRRG